MEQSRLPDEIIVVNDRSTDESLAISKKVQAIEPTRTRVICTSLRHAGGARNLGILESQSTAIMFLDADDVIGPNTLYSLASTLNADCNEIALCPWYRLEQRDRNWVAKRPSCQRRLLEDDALSGWLTGWYYPPCAVLWSRRALRIAGHWDEQIRINQDWDLMIRALIEGCPVKFTEGGAGFYRRLPDGQISLSGTRRNRECLISRVEGLRKIAYWLEERDQLLPYLGSISHAIDLIAEDARAEKDVKRKTDQLASDFGITSRVRGMDRKNRCNPANYHSETLAHLDASLIGTNIGFGQKFAAKITQANVQAETGLAQRGENLDLCGVKCAAPRPDVSVIIPAHNRAGTILQAIDSVLRQSFQKFELLIVDDGSSDNTCEVVQRYSDPRLRLLRQSVNKGVSAARNRGMKESRGDLIAFLDSDDEWFHEKLQLQVDCFRNRSEKVGLIYGGVENHYGDGRRDHWTPTHRGELYGKLLRSPVIHGGSSVVMIRRQVIASVGYFDEAIPAIEDYDYWLRICRHFEADFIAQPLMRYNDLTLPNRKSLNFRENHDARCYFYTKHHAELVRWGVAHLFLLETARRMLKYSTSDVTSARKLALAAIVQRPQSALAYRTLIKTTPLENLVERLYWRFA